MLKPPACILHPFVAIPALSDSQLYDQKEPYSHKHFTTSLVGVFKRFKLLHFF